jgi:hypothetical protein
MSIFHVISRILVRMNGGGGEHSLHEKWVIGGDVNFLLDTTDAKQYIHGSASSDSREVPTSHDVTHNRSSR